MTDLPAIDRARLPAHLPTAIRDELLEEYARENVSDALNDDGNPLHRLIFDKRMPAVWADLQKLKADDLQLVDFLWGATAAVRCDYSSARALRKRVATLRVDIEKTAHKLAKLLAETNAYTGGVIANRPPELLMLFDLVRAVPRTKSVEQVLSAEKWPPQSSRREWASSAPSIEACIDAIARFARQLDSMYYMDEVEAALEPRKGHAFYQSFRFLWVYLRDKGQFVRSQALAQVMIDVIKIACQLPPDEDPDVTNMLKVMVPK